MEGVPAKGILDGCSAVAMAGKEGLDLPFTALRYHRKDVCGMLEGAASGGAVWGSRAHPLRPQPAHFLRQSLKIVFKKVKKPGHKGAIQEELRRTKALWGL